MIYVVYLYDMNNCIRSAKYECNIKNVLYQTKQTKYTYVVRWGVNTVKVVIFAGS